MQQNPASSFRGLMGRFVTGVAVVLTSGDEGPVGLTVNSFTSLSLDPPLILFCAQNVSRAARAVIEQGRFSVNILSESQKDISRCFAGAATLWDRTNCRSHGPWLAIPDCNGILYCEVDRVHPGGDHTIVIGCVKDIEAPFSTDRPLIYHEGRYGKMLPVTTSAPG